MKYTVATAALLATADAFSFSPKQITSDIAKGCATAATCAALVFGSVEANAAVPVASVDIDFPQVLKSVTDEQRQKQIAFLEESIESMVGSAVKVQLPEKGSIQEIATQAIKGGGSILINGQEVGFQVVASEQGALTVQLTQAYLPKLPFVGLGNQQPVVPVPQVAATPVAPSEANPYTAYPAAISETTASSVPFWDKPIFGGAIRVDVDLSQELGLHRAITPLDVIGVGSAGLGVVYGASYGYYNYAKWKAEQDAKAKQEAAKAKKAAKAAAAKEEAPATDSEIAMNPAV